MSITAIWPMMRHIMPRLAAARASGDEAGGPSCSRASTSTKISCEAL